jgi:hypothetical protein
MRPRDAIVQEFLDAGTTETICDGRIPLLCESSLTLGPNCGVTADCPLFCARHLRGRRWWLPGLGDTGEAGCLPYRLLQQWKRAHQYWLVRFNDHPVIDVQSKNADQAVYCAWWELLRKGVCEDELRRLAAAITNKGYEVRER